MDDSLYNPVGFRASIFFLWFFSGVAICLLGIFHSGLTRKDRDLSLVRSLIRPSEEGKTMLFYGGSLIFFAVTSPLVPSKF